MKNNTYYFINKNNKEEFIRKNNAKFKKYLLLTLIFGIFFIILTIFFIINFQIDPNTFITVYFFLSDLIVLIIFVFLLERLLAIKEESVLIRNLEGPNEPPIHYDKKNEEAQKIKTGGLAFLNKIFRIFEEFPYIKNKTGRKKIIFKILGWICIVLLFSISIIVREAVVEFGGSCCFRNTILQWTVYFGFYIFVLSMGSFIIYLTSKYNPYHIFKLSIFGVMIIIQLPALIDYFFRPSALPYSFVKWEDFFKVFGSFTLHPDLDYAVGIGHFVMIIILMIFFSLYVIMRRIKYASQYKSRLKFFFISSRGILSAILIYIVIIFSSISATIIRIMLELSFGSSHIDQLTYSLLFDLYFFPLFIYLAFVISYKAQLKNNNLLYFVTRNVPKGGKKANFQGIIEKEDEYKSTIRLEMIILIIVFLIFYVFKFLIIWVFPDFDFSF